MQGRPDLTRREQATLAAVARRLSNVEIAEEFGVSVRTVESHIAALRRKLHAGSRRELIDGAQGLLGRPVPGARDSFVGREEELSTASAYLQTHRWVTITGPAGVGKTRLALEIARHTPSVVVEAEFTETGSFLQALASALDIEAGQPSALLAACSLALANAHLLLVVDNADRVVDEAAETLRRLLARVPSLQVLVTSRVPLHASGEVVVELSPLALTLEGPAVRLFRDRASAAARSTDLDDVALLARICERLEGMPLAIELAAARTRHLGVAELDRLLQKGFGTLSGARWSPRRHAALDSAFAWSWEVLDEGLQDVLRHLAALPRTFDLDLAAAAVGHRVDAEVAELSDHSMIVRLGDAWPASRFRLLAPLREFVLGQTGPEIQDAVLERHARHYRQIAVALAPVARTDDTPSSQALAHLLCPEVAAALRWATRNGDPSAPDFAAAVGVGVAQYGPDPEMVQALCEAATDARLTAAASPRVLLAMGHALSITHLDLVAALTALASAQAQRDGDPQAALAAAQLTGIQLTYRDRPQEAAHHLKIAQRHARALDDRWELAVATQFRARAARRAGRPWGETFALLEEARRAFAEAGDGMHVNDTRYMMALVAAEAGRTETATRWAAQCLRYAQERENELELAHARLVRWMAAPDADRAELDAAIRGFRGSGDLRCLSRALVLRAAREAPAPAEQTLREARSAGAESGDDRSLRIAGTALVRLLFEAGRSDAAEVELGALTSALRSPLPEALLPDGLREVLPPAWGAAQ
ncbi:LuxR C-terminal-related transcriptional regulator [Nocardioides dubius]|uniref:HTH luxR-type domain-containing protein n=1 Tax=Nocardioides dubius TaxID=317019 RepID=A0ABP4EE14_9ACTN